MFWTKYQTYKQDVNKSYGGINRAYVENWVQYVVYTDVPDASKHQPSSTYYLYVHRSNGLKKLTMQHDHKMTATLRQENQFF
jgi:hypothetical protein